jgi:hypothetical protein
VTGAFKSQENSPGLIKIAIDSLVNPPVSVGATNSFVIKTFTRDGYALDELDNGLLLDFFCEYPCQTCDPINRSLCLSCFGGEENQILFEETCVSECPIGYSATRENDCMPCETPCATCGDTASSCTSCIDNYWYFAKTKKCEELVLWPFPWLLGAIFWFTVIAISECRTNGESKFKEAFVAMLSFIEVGSWANFAVFTWFRTNVGYECLGALLACSLYLALNLSHSLTHCCCMCR